MIEDNGIGIPENKKEIIFEKGVKGELSKGHSLQINHSLKVSEKSV